MKRCNHKWRVGSKNAEFIKGKIVTTSLNIWCEECGKKIKAKYFSDINFPRINKWINKKIKKPTKIKLI